MNTKLSFKTIIMLLLFSLFLSLVATPTATQAAVNKIYFTTTTDDWCVKRANPDGTNVETLHSSTTGTPYGITIDPDNNKIYFTDNHSSVSKIQRMNLDGTNLEDVVTGVMAISIAVDRFAGKIYYTTKDDWSVKRADTDGTDVENLYTSTGGSPWGIALDTKNGKVYFSDKHSTVQKIFRANLDGSNREDVLTGVQVVSIALDVEGGKMYFTTDDDFTVKRADMDGTDVETLHTSTTGTPNGITLDLDSGKVYFSDNHSSMEKIQRMNLDGTSPEDVLTDIAALNIVTDPPVPTAITMKDFTAGNRASPWIWVTSLIVIFLLSKMVGKKFVAKQSL